MPTLERRIVIDTISFLKVLGVFAFLGLLYVIRDILALVFAALFLATLIRPAALVLEQKKIPKGVTVIVIYILLISFAVLSVGLVLPVLLQQGTHLLQSAGIGWQKLSGGFDLVKDFTVRAGLSDNFQSGLRSLEGQLSGFTQGIVATVGDVVGGLVALAVVLVMAFYMVVQEKDARRAFHAFVPEAYQDLISAILGQVQDKMGWWLLGQLALCGIIGVLYFIGLTVIGYDSALVLALFGGFTEFVPYLGPILGGIPVIIVGAASGSLFTVILGVVMLVLIQQLENHIIVPKVMQKAVGLNPLVSIVALLVGARLFGIVGALLSIPVTTAVGVVLTELYRSHMQKKYWIICFSLIGCSIALLFTLMWLRRPLPVKPFNPDEAHAAWVHVISEQVAPLTPEASVDQIRQAREAVSALNVRAEDKELHLSLVLALMRWEQRDTQAPAQVGDIVHRIK